MLIKLLIILLRYTITLKLIKRLLIVLRYTINFIKKINSTKYYPIKMKNNYTKNKLTINS